MCSSKYLSSQEYVKFKYPEKCCINCKYCTIYMYCFKLKMDVGYYDICKNHKTFNFEEEI
jgi:hypothetical protein